MRTATTSWSAGFPTGPAAAVGAAAVEGGGPSSPNGSLAWSTATGAATGGTSTAPRAGSRRWSTSHGALCTAGSTSSTGRWRSPGGSGLDTWPILARHLARATYDVDPIGLDPVVAEMVWHVVNFLYFDYFRVEVEGAEHLPASGAALVVANHGGGFLPYDAAILTAAVANEPEVPRRLRVIGTEIFNMLPWVSHLYRKAGAAYAARGDVVHLLGAGRIVGVFPEGERGFMKPMEEAYRVQRLGRGGFVELAEEFSVPIIPAAIVGAEEVHPAVGTSPALAKLVRMVFPQQRVEEVAIVLNPIPLPIRWHIRILPPVLPTGGGAAADPLWVLEQTEAIRGSIQSSLDAMVARRH